MKTPETIALFDLPINNITMEEAVRGIEQAVDARAKTKIFFVNAFYMNVAWEDEEYRRAVLRGDRIFGDGVGIRIASKILRAPIIDNVNGTDMIFPLCALCQRRKFRLFLLGCEPGVAAGMKEWIEAKYPGAEVAGHYHGYFDREKEGDAIVGMINDSHANILLVGFSAPLQECWIDANADKLDCQVMIGVGGLFDVYAGDEPRPPKWLRKFGLEWLGRLTHEPTRLWRRYLVGNPLFLWRVFLWKYCGWWKHKKNTGTP